MAIDAGAQRYLNELKAAYPSALNGLRLQSIARDIAALGLDIISYIELHERRYVTLDMTTSPGYLRSYAAQIHHAQMVQEDFRFQTPWRRGDSDSLRAMVDLVLDGQGDEEFDLRLGVLSRLVEEVIEERKRRWIWPLKNSD